MSVYSPHIKTPQAGDVFNRGEVLIEWHDVTPTSSSYPAGVVETFDYYPDHSEETPQSGLEPDPESVVAVAPPKLTYEIEYADDYREDVDGHTLWHTLRRRVPQTQTSLTWRVGKMVKSETVRIRMRTRDMNTDEVSDWSEGPGNFAINVYKLIPPAIVSPVPGRRYSDYMLIILDESLSKDTYNQKVRYYIDYSSEKADVTWTPLIQGLPVGQNVFKWHISEDVPPADDYIIRVTVKNANCTVSEEEDPHQLARIYAYNIAIQQPGLFLIDTKPPRATLSIDNATGITNKIEHTVTITAEDETTGVEQMQLRECGTNTNLIWGNGAIDDCPSVEESIKDGKVEIGKASPYSEKLFWQFEDASGLRKLEGMFVDYGGNMSISEEQDVYLSLLRSSYSINDFIPLILIDSNGNPRESVFACTSNGEVWRLDPFPLLMGTQEFRDIRLLFYWNNQLYAFSFADLNLHPSNVYAGEVWVVSSTGLQFLYGWMDATTRPTAVAKWRDNLYLGFENGDVWAYDGATWARITVEPFGSAVSSMTAAESYLYIGLQNSSVLYLYNGTEFVQSDLET